MFKPGDLVKFVGVLTKEGGLRTYTYGTGDGTHKHLPIGAIGTVVENTSNSGNYVFVNWDGVRPDLMMLPTELESGV